MKALTRVKDLSHGTPSDFQLRLAVQSAVLLSNAAEDQKIAQLNRQQLRARQLADTHKIIRKTVSLLLSSEKGLRRLQEGRIEGDLLELLKDDAEIMHDIQKNAADPELLARERARAKLVNVAEAQQEALTKVMDSIKNVFFDTPSDESFHGPLKEIVADVRKDQKQFNKSVKKSSEVLTATV
mmetsp:Transcript_34037/g.67384  ORF Transcript_34037/g.67384 Transcript_34037/m.67384 type:complete len:183 (+) Transcript_34037:2-550(+)